MGNKSAVLLIGGFILGFIISYIVHPVTITYIQPYGFQSQLTFETMITNKTDYLVNETVTFIGVLNVSIPEFIPKTLATQLKPYLLKNNKISLQRLDGTNWVTVSNAGTDESGNVSFTITPGAGTFTYKLVYEGSELIKPTESNTLTITVA
jgi:hypothetical protein